MTGTFDRPVPVAFIVGSPRSGTTWLSRLVGAHPAVASTYETHLFNAYIGPLVEQWREHDRDLRRHADRFNSEGVPPESTIGLPYVLTHDEFQQALRRFALDVLSGVTRLKPGCELVVEKTPSHSAWIPEIEAILGPDTRYVHIIRDGYDVVSSLRRSADGWGRAWAPNDTRSATRRWATAVHQARRGAVHGERYLELRYEDLRADPAGVLPHVFSFLGVDASPEVVLAAVAGADDGLLLGGAAVEAYTSHPPEPLGFRRGTTPRELSERDLEVISGAAGDLLRDLGYLRTSDASRPLRLAHRVTGRAEALASSARRAAERASQAALKADQRPGS